MCHLKVPFNILTNDHYFHPQQKEPPTHAKLFYQKRKFDQICITIDTEQIHASIFRVSNFSILGLEERYGMIGTHINLFSKNFNWDPLRSTSKPSRALCSPWELFGDLLSPPELFGALGSPNWKTPSPL